MRPNLATLVEDFRKHSGETAVVQHRGNRRYATTYGRLATLAGLFAAELDRRNIAPGERVVLWGVNSAEWIAVFFGCLLRGVLVVPLDASGTAAFAQRVIADVSPRLVVGDAALLQPLANQPASLTLEDLPAHLPHQPHFAISDAVREDAPFQIVFTSGTTSEPKGIVHTHRNVLASLRPIETEIGKYRKYERWVHPLRFLHSVPLSHVFGQFMGLWVPAVLAAEVHFAAQPDPARTIEMVHRERISVLVAVPRVLELLRAHLLERFAGLAQQLDAAQDLSALKRWWYFRRVHRALGWKFWAVISGGAALPPELEIFWNRLGFALIQGYGMTETAALVTLNHPFKIGKGTLGKALPGREVKLTGEGEILVRGDMLAQATWQGGRMHRREGEWLATGDLAEQNASGELRFLGRKGDAIVTASGMNVHPADLEDAMKRQTGVRGCAVVGCQMHTGTEPVAIVLFAGDDLQLRAAVDAANRDLASHQQIRRVLRWPEMQLPYTATGKLLRRNIAAWACAALEGSRNAGAARPADALLQAIADVTGESIAAADPDATLSEDLHLDSLGIVQLQSLLQQRMNVEIDEDRMAAARTLGQLRDLVGHRLEQAAQVVSSSAPPTHAADLPPDVEQDVYPRWPWSWPVLWLRVLFLELILRPLVWLLAAPKVVGTVDVSGPLLIVCNHVTAYDGALVLYALPGKLRRRLAVAMSGEMLRDFRHGRNQAGGVRNMLAPLAYGLVTALFNVFPLPRRRGFRRSFAHAGEALDRGYSVLIFPEGTRSRTGQMASFRSGVGLLQKESGVDVLPVALLGMGPSKARTLRGRRIAVHLGAPVPDDRAAGPAQTTALLETRVKALLASGEDESTANKEPPPADLS